MFSWSRKQQLPSYIEGTQGLYVRRASPPRVPSLSSHTRTLAKKSSIAVDVSTSNNIGCAQDSSTTSQPSHSELRGNKGEPVTLYADGPTVRPHSDSALSVTSTASLPPSHGHLMVNHIDSTEERRSPMGNLSSQSFRYGFSLCLNHQLIIFFKIQSLFIFCLFFFMLGYHVSYNRNDA